MSEANSKFDVRKTNKKEWGVFFGDQPIATIHLDYQDQADKLILTTADPECRLTAKRLALSHAVQFVTGRKAMLTATLRLAPELEMEEYDSDNLMGLDKIPPSIAGMAELDLDRHLADLVQVADGKFQNLHEMLNILAGEIRTLTGIQISVDSIDDTWTDEQKDVTFRTEEAQPFRVWHSISAAGFDPERSMCIVPPYHPSNNGLKSGMAVNGNTGSVISRGEQCCIERLFSPQDSRTGEESLFSDWGQMVHPYHATGTTIGIRIDQALAMTESGYEKIKELLLQSLGQADSYVSIIGGFNPPGEHPLNILQGQGRPSPHPNGGDYLRGSESACYWQYKTLEQEGCLDGAQVPHWFYREGWLAIFQSQEGGKDE